MHQQSMSHISLNKGRPRCYAMSSTPHRIPGIISCQLDWEGDCRKSSQITGFIYTVSRSISKVASHCAAVFQNITMSERTWPCVIQAHVHTHTCSCVKVLYRVLTLFDRALCLDQNVYINDQVGCSLSEQAVP